MSSPQGKIPTGNNRSNSPTNSGEDLGSTSTSSPDSKCQGSVETAKVADLTDENAKLKRDNEMLSSELAQAKKQCDELVSFLTEYVKVGPDQINRIMRQGSCMSMVTHEDEHHQIGEPSGNLKLFGVWVREDQMSKKRGREDGVGYHAPLMKSSKVCN